jgi:hypothetical protein
MSRQIQAYVDVHIVLLSMREEISQFLGKPWEPAVIVQATTLITYTIAPLRPRALQDDGIHPESGIFP